MLPQHSDFQAVGVFRDRANIPANCQHSFMQKRCLCISSESQGGSLDNPGCVDLKYLREAGEKALAFQVICFSFHIWEGRSRCLIWDEANYWDHGAPSCSYQSVIKYILAKKEAHDPSPSGFIPTVQLLQVTGLSVATLVPSLTTVICVWYKPVLSSLLLFTHSSAHTESHSVVPRQSSGYLLHRARFTPDFSAVFGRFSVSWKNKSYLAVKKKL